MASRTGTAVETAGEVAATVAAGGGPEDPVTDVAAVGELAEGEHRERKQRKQQKQDDAAAAKARQVAPTGKVLRSNYQPIILMEFIGCLVLTAATPIVTKKESDGLSPYAGADMVKLASITVLYFFLAALSVGGRGPGRFAAWLGGLVLIVDGLHEASNIAKVFGLFTGGLASAASSGSSAAATGLASPSAVQGVAGSALNPGLVPQSQQQVPAQDIAARQGGGSIVAPGWRGAI